MDWQNGIWSQINKLEPVQFKLLTAKDLTDALIKISAKTTSNSYDIYLNSDTAEMFWDVISSRNFINVYGIKQIGKQNDLFIYEGVLFDKFPEDYETLYINYRTREGCERCEEIELIELTDTKIVFKISFEFPSSVTEFTIQWH